MSWMTLVYGIEGIVSARRGRLGPARGARGHRTGLDWSIAGYGVEHDQAVDRIDQGGRTTG
jgi:hypothetical protein